MVGWTQGGNQGCATGGCVARRRFAPKNCYLLFAGYETCLNFQVSIDYGWEEGALSGGTKNAHWGGIAGWVRYKVTDVLEPALRVEYYRDDDGFTTGLRQSLVGVTVTINYKIG